jgi:nitrous-oxide reductase
VAVNWKKAEEYAKAGKGVKKSVRYAHNTYDEKRTPATTNGKRRRSCSTPAN